MAEEENQRLDKLHAASEIMFAAIDGVISDAGLTLPEDPYDAAMLKLELAHSVVFTAFGRVLSQIEEIGADMIDVICITKEQEPFFDNNFVTGFLTNGRKVYLVCGKPYALRTQE